MRHGRAANGLSSPQVRNKSLVSRVLLAR